MNEPVMYPLTDYPDNHELFESFAELRECVEDLDESLNFVVSWFRIPAYFNDPDNRSDAFSLLIFMPRISKTAQFECHVNPKDRTVVDDWLNGYVRERTMRWYGWT